MRPSFIAQLPLIDRAVQTFSWADPRAYANFLAQSHHMLAKSTRLYATACARLGAGDEVLHQHFAGLMMDTKRHELLALHDIRRLGYAPSDLPELPITAALYERQYYKCEHGDPATLLGYVLALEGAASCLGRAVGEAGLPAQAPRAFLSTHAGPDADAIEATLKALEGLPESRLAAIRRNMGQTAQLYVMMLDAARK